MDRDNKGRFIKGHLVTEGWKMDIAHKNRGKRASPSTEFQKGHKPWNTGLPKELQPIFGDKNPNWKGGISPINKLVRRSQEYIQWRKSVFERDNFTCQQCYCVGFYLEPHHIKSFADFPEERFNIKNGITLCKSCHKKTDNYAGRKRVIDNSILSKLEVFGQI